MGCNCKAESTDTKGVIEQVDITIYYFTTNYQRYDYLVCI